jgi:hypothetical protein
MSRSGDPWTHLNVDLGDWQVTKPWGYIFVSPSTYGLLSPYFPSLCVIHSLMYPLVLVFAFLFSLELCRGPLDRLAK